MRRLPVVLGLSVALLLAGVVAFREAGRFLVVADPLPARADAIVIMAGAISGRVQETARLYERGIAPRVVITRTRRAPGALSLRARGVFLPESAEQTRTALLALGVPEVALRTLGRRGFSTRSEARAIARWACRHHVRSLVVVTSPAHTRRTRLILRRTLGPAIALSVRPAPEVFFPAAVWWRVRHVAKEILGEYEKLAHFWLRERWQIRPCGGLRRAQAPPAALRMSGASSPLACSSRTMSQPPTNFPPTKTCGMVGQFV